MDTGRNTSFMSKRLKSGDIQTVLKTSRKWSHILDVFGSWPVCTEVGAKQKLRKKHFLPHPQDAIAVSNQKYVDLYCRAPRLWTLSNVNFWVHGGEMTIESIVCNASSQWGDTSSLNHFAYRLPDFVAGLLKRANMHGAMINTQVFCKHNGLSPDVNPLDIVDFNFFRVFAQGHIDLSNAQKPHVMFYKMTSPPTPDCVVVQMKDVATNTEDTVAIQHVVS